ncbi:hypothetical protein CRM94_28580 [Burkholderia gladioli]|uniref:Uncharacterized protein n=1 Tax=Burkholderia gladioli TaxID=28095 RepID=A0A2A7S3Y1_BURGA|nr:hypothetical protein CRM94_28580 [Burkholderia gladioli]
MRLVTYRNPGLAIRAIRGEDHEQGRDSLLTGLQDRMPITDTLSVSTRNSTLLGSKRALEN